MQLFGFEISRKIGAKTNAGKDEDIVSFVPPTDKEGTSLVNAASGYFGQFVDIDGTAIVNEKDIIIKYRNASTLPECDAAISDITDAAIVSAENSAPVSLIMEDLEFPQSIKKKISDEFEKIVDLLQFNRDGTEIFRRWYIDGRLYYHIIIDPKKAKEGIKEVRYIDPTKIKKVREVSSKFDKVTGVKMIETKGEYFIFGDNVGLNNAGGGQQLKIDTNAVVYVPSGIVDETGRCVVSNMHKALKLVNQLRMMEDALVIYRISRAPERRIFYIDTGNLPKGKAEEYVQSIMSKYRNKLVYDANTGDIRDDRRAMSMLEDFWLPRREGGRGTEITTLPGGENLGQMDDVKYFQEKLYRALNVPISRLISETGFNMGRASEISRDEVKFHKFVMRLRKKFSYLFIDMLRVQLLLKGIITEDDWNTIKENIAVDFCEDNYFTELKEFEILNERLNMLNSLESYVGKYYSETWVRHNILRQSDQDIERIDAEIAAEKPPEEEESAPEEGEGALGEEELSAEA
jgi:hypothetical protein